MMEILKYGSEVEVLEPPELRKLVISELDKARQVYAARKSNK
jgi:predicted DNA-binding transcriptional regulator YafY